ncbi:MAG: four helix bundle protein [Candidatus Omnitrophica bacterium]|nr:four helix bundle protein [Candidatus Omnitrophota bacterium]
MKEPNYRKLLVWEKAHKNALAGIKLIELFNKKHEKIAEQFLAAITSVGANIAEGSGGYKGKEFARFLNIALRSAFETDNWLQVIKDSNIIGQLKILNELEDNNLEIIKMLIALIKTQQN